MDEWRTNLINDIESGKADLVSRLSSGDSVLMWLVRLNELKPVECVLKKRRDNHDEMNSMHIAIVYGYKEMVKLLFKYKVSPNIFCNNGDTHIIRMTIDNENYEMTELLLQNGVHPDVQDTDGTTALMEASDLGDDKLVEMILKYNPDVNKCDNDGWTPLMYAVQGSNIRIVKLLIEKGANVNHRNNTGCSIFLVAVSNTDRIDIMELLIEKGADINSANDKGYTPFMIAKKDNYEDCIELLKKHGAIQNEMTCHSC
jgi:ankyrin repeat protein